jgi:hypothetical protein
MKCQNCNNDKYGIRFELYDQLNDDVEYFCSLKCVEKYCRKI